MHASSASFVYSLISLDGNKIKVIKKVLLHFLDLISFNDSDLDDRRRSWAGTMQSPLTILIKKLLQNQKGIIKLLLNSMLGCG